MTAATAVVEETVVEALFKITIAITLILWWCVILWFLAWLFGWNI